MVTLPPNVSDSLQTRASLLSRVKDLEDAASWEEFFRTYARMVQGLARQRGLSSHEAEEVAQEVFDRVARTIHQFQRAPHAGAFRSWLFRLTRWRADDKRRRRSPFSRAAIPERPDGESGTPIIERLPAPEDARAELEQQARRQLIESLFRQLEQRVPPKQLQIFQLIMIDEVPAVRVAKMFGLSPTHVYVIKHRVLQKLREEFDRLPLDR
jgi:RNA polymerase sigma-70 factor, ECF subfamily